MATSRTSAARSDVTEEENLVSDDVVSCSVDFNGRPVLRSNSGCWKSAAFIIGVEMAERFAYYGISANLVNYLTGPLGQSTAAAAANVNAWSGTSSLTPLLGAFIADSYLGRFRMIISASLLYILGLGLLTLSAAIDPIRCRNSVVDDDMDCFAPRFQIILFFSSLYLVAFSVGGHKPCLQAFGADQFDEENVKELKSKSSFFNWWNFCLCVSVLVGLLVLSYIQENLSWELGFGIPCIVMSFALIVFLLGSMKYRFRVKIDQRNPFARIFRVFVQAARNWRAPSTAPPLEDNHFRFLDKAIVEAPSDEAEDLTRSVCSIDDVEDAKVILKLLPISFACIPLAVVYAQSTTLFTKQGATMDRHITATFQIPAAGLQAFTPASIVLFVPFYDRVLVPLARAITHKPSGISMLQRIGAGLLLGVISMLIAGFTERKRLETAREYELVDLPMATIPMSVWWLAPQYLVLGIADILTFVGLQEFFYNQVPGELRSMGIALSFSVAGIGGFLSSFIVSFVDSATSGHGRESWFSNNLNRAHLDYFYWVLAMLNVFSFATYVYFAKSYVYRRGIIVQ